MDLTAFQSGYVSAQSGLYTMLFSGTFDWSSLLLFGMAAAVTVRILRVLLKWLRGAE